MTPDYVRIPRSTLDGLADYILHGIPTGDFLRAVLSNDLEEAYGRADDFNTMAMFEIVHYVVNCVPRQARGSPEAYAGWVEHHRKLRREERITP